MPSTPRKIVLLFVLTIVFMLTWVYPQLEFPAPGGSHDVGRTTIRWVDSARPEVLTETLNDLREVVAMVWYPAVPGTGVQAGYFLNLAVLSGELVNSGEVSRWEVLGLRLIRSSIPVNAAPIKQPFPVVILSPGNGTNVEFYSSLASEIASHGYIVIGINHPFDVAAVKLSGGEVAPYDKDQWSLDAQAHQAYTADRIKVRTADVLFALERLDEINSTGPFAGTMDLSAVAVAGHSLGGITAAEACKADPRFRACLNLDGLQAGGPFSVEETAFPPAQPFMFLTKEAQLQPRWLERFETISESYWVVVQGASHQSFTDGPLLQSALVPGSNHAGRILDLIQEFSIAFLDHTLKGQPGDLILSPAHQEHAMVRAFPSR